MVQAASELAPQQVLEQALRLLTRERAKASHFGYPAQRGSRLAPMSTLEQRRQELQQQFGAKGAPYGKKVQAALARSGEGLSPAAIAQLLQQQEGAQRGFEESKVLPMLRSQFGTGFVPREAAFRRESEGELGRGLEETRAALAAIQRQAAGIQQRENLETAQVMQALGQGKQAQRETLLGALEESAGKKHAIGNMERQAAQQARTQEAYEPQRRVELLTQALRGPAGVLEREGVDPAIARQEAMNVLKALQTAGVDIQQPPSQWTIGKAMPSYPGQRVAGTPPEMSAAWDTLERMHPSLKETSAAQRKALEQEALQAAPVGERAVGRIPEAMRGRIQNLEHEGQQRLRKDIGAISQHYIQLGQYGSPQHQKAVEERTAAVNKAILERRNALLEGELGTQLAHTGQERMSGLQKLVTHGGERQREFMDLMKKIKGAEKTGEAKFHNRQDELDELYRNYQNERAWEWPHMRAQAHAGAMRNIFGGLEQAGVDFPHGLARLQTGYSSLEQELAKYRTEAERQAAEYRTVQAANQGLHQQLQQRQQAEAAAAAAEANRRWQEQQAAQYAQAEAQRRAAEEAEAQRLAAFAPPAPQMGASPHMTPAQRALLTNLQYLGKRGYVTQEPAQSYIEGLASKWQQHGGDLQNPQFVAALQQANAQQAKHPSLRR